MTWSDVAVAAAFVIGVVVGGLGVIRVVRSCLEYLRAEHRRSEEE
jgi:hypothetical protein